MFRQLKNIETSFQHVRLFTFVLIAATMTLCCFAILESYKMVSESSKRIYILTNGRALEAIAADRGDNIAVESRDHIKNFHRLFFTLDPDEKVIESNIRQALYLSDATAKQQYDDLKESGYYSGIISGNVSQKVTMDSIHLNIDNSPYYFKYYGIQKLIRPTSTLSRILITEGYLRNVSRSDNNSHGFLIEKWKIIDNRDLNLENR